MDYVKIAEAMGAAARRVTTQEEFNAAFQEALESKTPFVIDAIVAVSYTHLDVYKRQVVPQGEILLERHYIDSTLLSNGILIRRIRK